MRCSVEVYDPGKCPRCGEPMGERPAAAVDASGVITCSLCGAKLRAEWIAGRAAIAAEVATA